MRMGAMVRRRGGSDWKVRWWLRHRAGSGEGDDSVWWWEGEVV
jgi:hypothetical protein